MPKKRSQNKKFNNPSTEVKRLIDSYNDRRPVVGVTSIDPHLFVLRHPSQQQIQVYDLKSFKQQQTIQLIGLSDDTSQWTDVVCN
jgi:hypothetical protein